MPITTTTTVADDAAPNETRARPCATVHAADVQYATDASTNATKHEHANDGWYSVLNLSY